MFLHVGGLRSRGKQSVLSAESRNCYVALPTNQSTLGVLLAPNGPAALSWLEFQGSLPLALNNETSTISSLLGRTVVAHSSDRRFRIQFSRLLYGECSKFPIPGRYM